jgi:hypothetical protein
MKRTIAFFGIASVVVMFAAVGFTYAAGTGVRTQTGSKQILVDGDAEKVGYTDWTPGNNAVVSKSHASPHTGNRALRVAYGGTDYPNVIQNILTTGKTYKITAWFRGDGGANPSIDDLITQLPSGSVSSQWQYGTQVWVAGTPSLKFTCNAGSAHWCEFDDIVVTEYTGITVIGGKQILVDGDMEKPGTANWGPSVGSITKQSGASPGGSGVRILRTTSASTYAITYQTPGVISAGKTYRVTGWWRGDGVSGAPQIGDNDSFRITGLVSNAWQRLDAVFSWPFSGFGVGVTGAAGTYAEFDDLVVTEYTGKTIVGGKQLLVDGDFEKASTSSWGGVGTFTKEPGGALTGHRFLRLTWSSGTYVDAYQSTYDGTVAGRTYRITGWARGDGVNAPMLVWAGAQLIWTGTASTAWQRINVVTTANYASIYLMSNTVNGAGQYVDFDDIVLTEI